jgi:signal transduction histidine kinase/HAMP domain-containing protein
MPRSRITLALPLLWVRRSLSSRFLLLTVAGLVAISLVFLILFSGMYRARLEQGAQQTALQINKLFQATLENAMLKRDIDGLREIVQRLGVQDGIAAVMILHPSGEVRFSSDARLLGLSLLPDRLDESMPPLHGDRTRMSSGFITNAHGLDVFRSMIAVPNQDACAGCHGNKTQNPVNGILLVDFDAGPFRTNARNATLAMMGAGSMVVLLTLLGGWWFMRRYVLIPVAALTQASRLLAQGKLEARVQLQGEDELAQLGDTFNRMAEDLDASVKAKQEHEDFLQAVIDGVPDGIRVIGTDYRVIKTNRAFRELTESPVGNDIGRPCFAVSHQRTEPCQPTLVNCPLSIIAKHGEPVRCVQQFKSTTGLERHVEVYAAPIAIAGRDQNGMAIVESIRNLDQAIRFSHEQRLSALGQLAAGVAHEIHNPLSSIRFALQASLQSLDQTPPDPEGVQRHLVLIDEQINRCIEITGRLLRLGALPSEYPELVPLNSVLTETISLLQDEARERSIEIEYDLHPSNPRIVASDADLRMVVLNLVQNAFHAMIDGGRLQVSTRREQQCVELVIDDAGVGIDPALLPRIFDPFFGRRADGTKGAGLGLAIVKNLVERHGGRVSIEPLQPKGCRALVTFPSADHAV